MRLSLILAAVLLAFGVWTTANAQTGLKFVETRGDAYAALTTQMLPR